MELTKDQIVVIICKYSTLKFTYHCFECLTRQHVLFVSDFHFIFQSLNLHVLFIICSVCSFGLSFTFNLLVCYAASTRVQLLVLGRL